MQKKGLFLGVLLLFFLLPISVSAEQGGEKVRLSWAPLPDAVAYELLFIRSCLPTFTAGDANTILVKQDIYAPGVEVAFELVNAMDVWWQVRALNVYGQPITAFSQPERLLDGTWNATAPLTTANLDGVNGAKLYQVFSWIPVVQAAGYRVEVTSADGDDLMPAAPRRQLTIAGGQAFTLYDHQPYTKPGVYWWQVIAVDDDGRALGRWSEPNSFTVAVTGSTVAALGDSITHGGGAISNPPGELMYDWTSYAGFPIRNLGYSGDTTTGMRERFVAEVVPFAPAIVIIMGGINDLRSGIKAPQIIDNLNAIGVLCRQYGIIPVFVTIPPIHPALIERVSGQATPDEWQDEHRSVNQWIGTQLYHVDVAPLLTDPSGLLPASMASDGLHPDREGKAIIGQAIGAYIKVHFNDYLFS